MLLCLAGLGAVVYVVTKKPDLAVLEGVELVMYQQLTNAAAKGYIPETVALPVPDPRPILETPDPKALSETGGEQQEGTGDSQ